MNVPHTDMALPVWARALPAHLQPYVFLGRFDRPVGIWLLLQPGLWALALLTPSLSALAWPSFLFLCGAVVMRAAGCALNDLLDRDLDAQVTRTALRPLAAGALTRTQAIAFLILMLMLGGLVLFQFPPFAVAMGMASLALVAAYPLMKRIIWWPQIFLGLTFNWGVLVASAALLGEISVPALWLYAGAVLWTFGYDTIYAAQDMQDDARVGVKSSALRLGRSMPLVVMAALVLAVLCWGVAGLQAGLGGLYLAGLVVITALFAQNVRDWNPDDPASSLRQFRAHVSAGWVVWLIILLDRVL